MADVKQSHPQAFQQLEQKLKNLGNASAKVGWFDSSKYDDGTPVAYVAAIQELGHGPIPPRPFMRPAQTKNQARWREIAAIGAKKVLDGSYTDGRQAMDALAYAAQGDVQKAITAVWEPKLSPVTLWARYYRKFKGQKITGSFIGALHARIHGGDLTGQLPPLTESGSKPLIDTGKLQATLTYVVDITE